jgi:tetratricopeptide (TPR) repeat protein
MNRQQRRAAARAGGGGPAAPALVAQGIAHHRAGRLERAEAAYRQALAAAPADPEALQLLGALRRQQGRPQEAIELIGRSLALAPRQPDVLCNLGGALRDVGRRHEALAAYRQAILLAPLHPEAHRLSARLLADLGRHEAAAAAYRQALAIRPGLADGHAALAAILRDLGQLEAAAASLRQAIALDPTVADWHWNLGLALGALERIADAVPCLERALALAPPTPIRERSLGAALARLGRHREAVAAFRRALALDPDDAAAHGGLSLSLLACGELEEGFREYRWRLRCPGFADRPPAVDCPPWEGEPLAGRSILVHGEQGFGDCLQFVRFVRPLVAMGARVRLLAEAPLVRLFSSLPGVTVSDEPGEGHDYRAFLMCLPRLLGTGLATIPADIPYLAPSAGKAARWAERLAGDAGELKVGLVWAGDPRKHDLEAYAIDHRRSMALARLAPLARVAGVRLFSLQLGEAAAEAQVAPAGLRLVDLAPALQDFDDTAAAVVNLDLVIAVDTAIVHLAGALGRPVWVLSRFDGCWRWLNGRADSPWYPSARIYHQPAPGDWDAVVRRVADDLAALAGSRAAAAGPAPGPGCGGPSPADLVAGPPAIG